MGHEGRFRRYLPGTSPAEGSEESDGVILGNVTRDVLVPKRAASDAGSGDVLHLDEVVFAAIGRLREVAHDVEPAAFVHLDCSLVE